MFDVFVLNFLLFGLKSDDLLTLNKSSVWLIGSTALLTRASGIVKMRYPCSGFRVPEKIQINTCSEMVIRLFLCQVLFFLNTPAEQVSKQTKGDSGTFEVIKSTSYTGKSLEAIYRINYRNSLTKDTRYFEVIKTDAEIKNYFLADYLLVERDKKTSSIICYPTGWESLKAIKESELKETCQLIIKGKITSESIK